MTKKDMSKIICKHLRKACSADETYLIASVMDALKEIEIENQHELIQNKNREPEGTQNAFKLNEDLLNANPEQLGETMVRGTVSAFSGTCKEIGKGVLRALQKCESEKDYALVNETITAITGSSLESTLEFIEKLRNQGYYEEER